MQVGYVHSSPVNPASGCPWCRGTGVQRGLEWQGAELPLQGPGLPAAATSQEDAASETPVTPCPHFSRALRKISREGGRQEEVTLGEENLFNAALVPVQFPL